MQTPETACVGCPKNSRYSRCEYSRMIDWVNGNGNVPRRMTASGECTYRTMMRI